MKKYGLFFLIALLLGAFIFIGKRFFWDDNVYYLAVVWGMNQPGGQAMKQAVQLYLDQINQQGGIGGKTVKLIEFDDENNPDLAKQKALQIANDNSIIGVIGHGVSGTALAAAPIYKKHGIPAITGTATADQLTQENDWYFRTTFTNREQGALLANYIKILGYDTASMIFDENTYGQSLANAFIQTAKMIDLEIKHQWGFKRKDKPRFEDIFQQIQAAQRNDADEVGVLFLAIHSNEAVQIITKLRQQSSIPIIGADALSNRNFSKRLEDYPQERTQPGYFTDGIYLTMPFLSEFANGRALDFRQAFVTQYQREPSKNAALSYDTAKVMLHALKTMPQHGISIQEKRRHLKDSLWQISQPETAVEGITGTIYFDKHGNAVKSILIGIYQKGKPILAQVQYRILTNQRNLKQDVLSQVFDYKIIKVNEYIMAQTKIVYVGIDFNEISELDTKTSTYTADFYLWFRFKTDDFKDHQIDFLNIVDPKEGRLENPMIDEVSQIENEEFTTRAYRLKAQFKGNFDFRNYPLDHQILPIQLRHQQNTRDTLIYVVDKEGMRTADMLAKFKEKGVFSVDGWQIDNISFFEEAQDNDSTFGLPDYFHVQQRIEYSLFNVAIEIKRDILSFILKNLFPTFILILLGYGIFFTTETSIQIALGVNIILPTSVLHVRLASELPNIAYFTLVEFFFYMSYLLAIMCISAALFMHVHQSNEKKIRSLLIMGRIGYPIFVLLCFTLVAFQFLQIYHRF